MPYKDPNKKKEYQKEWGKKNNKKVWERRKNDLDYIAYQKSYMKDYSKEYEKTPKKRFSNTKNQAKKRDLEFSLSLDDFIDEISKPCSYCSNLLGEKSIFASGLDRKDNSKGYTIDNICSCCWICNSIKGEFLSYEEMKNVASLLLKMRKIQE